MMLPESLRRITAHDILSLSEYEAVRAERRHAMAVHKRNRRVSVGPYAVFLFEDYHTMWHQVHEMLAIERGGAAQLPDELEAYNPLIPQGNELVATVMFQIDDETLRRRVLGALGGIEETVVMRFQESVIRARAEADVDRTSAEGKASSVQFVHFHFTEAEKSAFMEATEIMVGFEHPHYRHFGVIPSEVKHALCADF